MVQRANEVVRAFSAGHAALRPGVFLRRYTVGPAAGFALPSASAWSWTRVVFVLVHKNIAGILAAAGRYTRWLMNNIGENNPFLTTQANQVSDRRGSAP